MDACDHLRQLSAVEATTPDGCQDCLQSGARWVHLRLCMACMHVGCCDSSPNRHATAHNQQTGHPVVQSYEPAEDWAYCYLDGTTLPHVAPALRRPVG